MVGHLQSFRVLWESLYSLVSVRTKSVGAKTVRVEKLVYELVVNSRRGGWEGMSSD